MCAVRSPKRQRRRAALLDGRRAFELPSVFMKNPMLARVTSVGTFLPEKRMSNQELARFLDTTDDWIVTNTGISNRHIAADDQAASDLGYHAAEQALQLAGVPAEDVDLIIVATSTADYRGYPSTACIIQDRLGANRAAAFDITAACTGFVYGLETARNFIFSGAAEKVLLIGAEVNSKVLDWSDRRTCVLFGDGAGAVMLEANSDGRGVVDSILRSDGSRSEVLTIPGGSRHPPQNVDKDQKYFLTMQGRPVYLFAIEVITEVIRLLLDRNKLTIKDISAIVPHQANIRIIDAAAKRLGVDCDLFRTNIHEVANTSAASIPLALKGLIEGNQLKKGDIVITVGFGGGLTYGGNLIRW